MRELPIGDESEPELLADSDPVWWDNLQGIPDLKQAVIDAQKTAPAGAVLLVRALSSIKEQTTTTLMHRLSTVEHPVTAWALHVELDARNVPPCLRPEMPPRSRQVEYLATLADLLWLSVRHPKHETKYERLRGVFRYPPRDDRWHRAAIWAYRQCRGRRYAIATRLGLTEPMRAHTLTMPTGRQLRDRRTFANESHRIRDAMTDYAMKHPDKSGQTTAESVTDRRMKIVTAFVKLDRNLPETARCIELIHGIAISRQTLTRQLRLAGFAGDCTRIVLGPF